LYPKAETLELKHLEEKLLEKLNEFTLEIFKRFADRKDTKNNFSILERQIKNMFELMMN